MLPLSSVGIWMGSNTSCVTITIWSECQSYFYLASGIWTGSNTRCVTFAIGSDCQCYCYPVLVSGRAATPVARLSQFGVLVLLLSSVRYLDGQQHKLRDYHNLE